MRDHFDTEGVPYSRLHDGATKDGGDFLVGPWVCDAKSYASVTNGLREGMQGAMKAAARRPHLVPAVILKRPGYNVRAGILAFQLGDMARVLELLTFPPRA